MNHPRLPTWVFFPATDKTTLAKKLKVIGVENFILTIFSEAEK
jgi:hypothetical protein